MLLAKALDISRAVQSLLTSPHKQVAGLIAILFGGLTLLFGASSVVGELRDALNAIWRVPVDQNSSEFTNLFRLVKERVYSFALILCSGLLLLLSLALTGWLGALRTVFGWHLLSSSVFFHLFVHSVSFLVAAFVFAAIDKVIPAVDLTWKDVTVGGLATSLLFLAGKQLITLYVKEADLGSAYGAAGSLIAVLVWMYYSAQVFFLGAEFTKVYVEASGSRMGGKSL